MNRRLVGGLLWALVVLMLFGPLIAPHDPYATDVGRALQAPSSTHWFGTDQVGRDVLSRVLVATRLDLAIAGSAVALSSVVGSLIGVVCGFYGGVADRWIGRVVDVLMAFPLFVVAMAWVAVLGNSVVNIVYATALINLPFYIRLARAEVAARRSMAWVQAARLSGASDLHLMTRVMLPNIMPALVMQGSLNLGWAILNGAGLSFIGLGVRPPMAEWGVMVGEGAQFMQTGQWWLVLFPGLALFLAVWTFSLAGDVLRDRFDPRRARAGRPMPLRGAA